LLKESKEYRKDKKVWIWSPFTIGTNFQREVKKGIKYEYVNGLFPQRRFLDSSLEERVEGGVILSLPETEIETYLRDQIDLKFLAPDEELINHLETLISKH
jgi:predicted methyltransferase MtxX (methanogen marker protein 4)